MQELEKTPRARRAAGGRFGRSGWYGRIFAWALANVTGGHEMLVRHRKRDLLAVLSGTVVEIGPGHGPNLSYYHRGVRWIGVEPNPHMQPYLERQAREAGIEIDLRAGSAERIPLGDEEADAVVSTLVLCSVDDVAESLREIRRVLKPGGRFVFLEHVGARRGSRLRRVQRAIRPVWSRLADGCHPDRDTLDHIRAAGFSDVHGEDFALPVPVVSPHVAGYAVK